jgi:peptidoglycan/xylan/chitin deacetylase (PgdA/CDA1 family)
MRRWRRASIALVILLLALVVGLWQLSKLRSFQICGELVDRVERDDPVIALTFDDGPREPDTARLLDLLARLRVRATFFMVGRRIEQHPELARRVIREGHEAGNHSYSHPRMVLVSPAFVREEISRTDALLRQAGARGTPLFRAPFGKKLFVLPWVLWRSGRRHVTFDVIPDPPDYQRPEARLIAGSVIDRVRPGSIVLLHDGGGDRSRTIAATELIITGLRRRGYRFTTVSRLLRQTPITSSRTTITTTDP